MFKFDKVSKSYIGGFQAIQQISFHINRGEMVYLRGHSGAGKSTILKLMSAIEHPSLGSVIFNGTDITHIAHKKVPFLRRKMGMIFQDYRLINTKTVYENVALPLEIEGYSDADILKRVNAALDMVGLINKVKYYPLMLSGGEQQRVGIARAIVHSPDVLLADEPTGNLDTKLAKEILRLFSVFNKQGVTVVIATHDDNFLEWKPCRQIILDHGMMVNDIPVKTTSSGVL